MGPGGSKDHDWPSHIDMQMLVSQYGRLPSSRAAQNGHADLLRALIGASANVNLQDKVVTSWFYEHGVS